MTRVLVLTFILSNITYSEHECNCGLLLCQNIANLGCLMTYVVVASCIMGPKMKPQQYFTWQPVILPGQDAQILILHRETLFI